MAVEVSGSRWLCRAPAWLISLTPSVVAAGSDDTSATKVGLLLLHLLLDLTPQETKTKTAVARVTTSLSLSFFSNSDGHRRCWMGEAGQAMRWKWWLDGLGKLAVVVGETRRS